MFQNTVSLFFYECKGMDFFAYFAFIIIFLPLHNGFIDLCEEGSCPTLWLCRPFRGFLVIAGPGSSARKSGPMDLTRFIPSHKSIKPLCRGKKIIIKAKYAKKSIPLHS